VKQQAEMGSFRSPFLYRVGGLDQRLECLDAIRHIHQRRFRFPSEWSVFRRWAKSKISSPVIAGRRQKLAHSEERVRKGG
jgi:hypothetical protein